MSADQPFKLKYAPHFGMFKHHAGEDLVEQIRFAHGVGFRAWEDNGMMGRSVADQERVAAALDDLGMTMGVFVAHAEWREPIYVRGGAEARKKLQEQMRRAVEVAERTMMPLASCTRRSRSARSAPMAMSTEQSASRAATRGVLVPAAKGFHTIPTEPSRSSSGLRRLFLTR